MLVSDFDFDLPDELIAQQPAARGASRLLVLDRATGARAHHAIAELPRILRPGDLLVVNDTRVFAARLLGHRVPSGGAVECLLLGGAGAAGSDRGQTGVGPGSDRSQAGVGPGSDRGHAGVGPGSDRGQAGVGPGSDRGQTGVRPGSDPSHVRAAEFDALVHPGQKLKPGAIVRFDGPAGVLMGEILERHYFGRRRIRLWTEAPLGVDALIDALGHMPLPPYIHRPDTDADRERYQTVFARARGSVAAPTAGLHFTREILAALTAAGVQRTEITLHVGYGTFKPVRTETVEAHVVDPEHYEISDDAATAMARARAEGRRIIAVGTTTTRALEDAAVRGGGRIPAGAASATAFIYPGFRFQVIDGLLTNFHLPRSSLLMLVAAFAGRERILETYRVAVEHRYRFYSYGDAMLIA